MPPSVSRSYLEEERRPGPTARHIQGLWLRSPGAAGGMRPAQWGEAGSPQFGRAVVKESTLSGSCPVCSAKGKQPEEVIALW